MLNDPNDPIADDVRATTSELVTNAIRHTYDGGELRAWDPRPDVPLRLSPIAGGALLWATPLLVLAVPAGVRRR
jgi:hypothetical protein